MNRRAAFTEKQEELSEEIRSARAANPSRLIASGTTDTYFDGSIGPVHDYEVWDHSAASAEDAILDRERKRLRKRNSVARAIFRSK